jgi:hypothetical protein
MTYETATPRAWPAPQRGASGNATTNPLNFI